MNENIAGSPQGGTNEKAHRDKGRNIVMKDYNEDTINRQRYTGTK